MRNSYRWIFTLLLLGGLLAADCAAADPLIQLNPVKRAPKDFTSDYGDHVLLNTKFEDGYPWFSNDGKLMLFTRRKPDSETTAQPPDEDWDVWVTYLKNRNDLVNASPGQALGNIVVAVPRKLETFPRAPGVPDGLGINTMLDERAIAYCEATAQPENLATTYRYKFTLFFSRTEPGEMDPNSGKSLKKMWKAINVKVKIHKTTLEIDSIVAGGTIAQTVKKLGAGINIANKNTTEPALTRDGKYLFWGSQAFANTEARFIYSSTPCGQLNQASQPYSSLDTFDPLRFKWHDQFTPFVGPPDPNQLSRTNYHHVLEQPNNGPTALVFEQCRAQNPASSLEAACVANFDHLDSTGFDANGSIEEIEGQVGNCCASSATFLNRFLSNGNNLRVTHPAVSGPKNPDGSWILFFMRGKDIWYTKISDQSPFSWYWPAGSP